MKVTDYQYLSEIRESNPPHRLGKTLVYLCKSLLLIVFGVITGCLLTYYSQNSIVLFPRYVQCSRYSFVARCCICNIHKLTCRFRFCGIHVDVSCA